MAALGAALLSGLSQGNGFLVLLLGCAFLLFDRRWLYAGVWAAAFATFMTLYFASYVPVINTTNPLHSLGRPFEVVLFAAVFSGSALGYPTEKRCPPHRHDRRLRDPRHCTVVVDPA